MQLDNALPNYDVRARHSITVKADPRTVRDELLRLSPRDVPMMVVLMALRSLPSLLLGRGALGVGGRPIVQQFERAGFVRLGTAEDELVLGAVGRFWHPSGGLRRVSAESFAVFAEPGWAKGAFNFRVVREGDHTLLSTETRVLATDAGARRSFRHYWRLIYPGSVLIRIAWLRAIKRSAERSQPANASRSRSTSSFVV
jgi:hypothetical protein